MTTKTLKLLPTICGLAMLLPLAGCPTEPQKPPKPDVVIPEPAKPTPEELQKEQTRAAARDDLKEGKTLYETGDFSGSLKKLLDSKSIWESDAADVQIEALKITAFDYCVSNKATLCKQQFERALKMNPDFDLLPGEKGHPLWGPAFEKAKKAVKQ